MFQWFKRNFKKDSWEHSRDHMRHYAHDFSSLSTRLLKEDGHATPVWQHEMTSPGTMAHMSMPEFIYRGQQRAFVRSLENGDAGDVLEVTTEDNKEKNHVSIFNVLRQPESYRLCVNPRGTRYTKQKDRSLRALILTHVYSRFADSPFAQALDGYSKETSSYYVEPFAQHYGFPTMALDVTFSPSVAAYFASLPPDNIDSNGDKPTVGAVYRIKSAQIVKQTRLHYVPYPMSDPKYLSRPGRQEAAVLYLKNIPNWDLGGLEESVEVFYFRHNADQEVAYLKENAQKRMLEIDAPGEEDAVRSILLDLPKVMDARGHIAFQLYDTLSSHCGRFPHSYIQTNGYKDQAWNEAAAFAMECLAFEPNSTNQEMKDAVAVWNETDEYPFINALQQSAQSYTKGLRDSIETKVAKVSSSRREIWQLANWWGEVLSDSQLIQNYVNACVPELRNMKKWYGSDFSKVDIGYMAERIEDNVKNECKIA